MKIRFDGPQCVEEEVFGNPDYQRRVQTSMKALKPPPLIDPYVLK
jgi:hypothetical protein